MSSNNPHRAIKLLEYHQAPQPSFSKTVLLFPARRDCGTSPRDVDKVEEECCTVSSAPRNPSTRPSHSAPARRDGESMQSIDCTLLTQFSCSCSPQILSQGCVRWSVRELAPRHGGRRPACMAPLLLTRAVGKPAFFPM